MTLTRLRSVRAKTSRQEEDGPCDELAVAKMQREVLVRADKVLDLDEFTHMYPQQARWYGAWGPI